MKKNWSSFWHFTWTLLSMGIYSYHKFYHSVLLTFWPLYLPYLTIFSRLHFTLFFVYLERNEHCFACTIMEMANQTLKMVQCCDCHIHISLNAIFRDFSKTNQRITKTKIPLDLSLRVGHVDMQHVYICIIFNFWPFDLLTSVSPRITLLFLKTL